MAFGNRSQVLYEAVHGIDPSPVLPLGQAPPVAGAEHTFGTDTNDTAAVEGILYRLVEQIGTELRRRRLAARRVGVTLDYADGGRINRQANARPATTADPSLFAAARAALHRAWIRRVRIRYLRVVCNRLVFPPAQLELFGADAAANQRRARLIGSPRRRPPPLRPRRAAGGANIGRLDLENSIHRKGAQSAKISLRPLRLCGER
ncbi:MAG: hypothetical protein U5R30_21475 [Deltaproteobacteria bacterium]|nr:hypothetical protein [Deltaproteobacteria bacterium]